jgi:hypothetical protein
MVALAALSAIGLHACIESPPKIPAIPASGLALRVHVFGASATDARRTFQAVREKNPSFSVVNEGGDGEVLLGLDNDSPKCVPPTGLCSFRVSYRIKDKKGDVVAAQTTMIQASSDNCSNLCAKALNKVAVTVLEAAAGALGSGGSLADADGGTDRGESASTAEDASVIDASPSAKASLSKKKPAGRAAAEPAKPDPEICGVGAGSRLPTEEAERRAAQVEALKRQNILDQAEYDCLRKAYLNRL